MMLSSPQPLNWNNKYVKDATYTILFGVLAVVLSQVQFQIPGVGDSNLREIPFLIGVFHISNPVFLVVLCSFSMIGSASGFPLWALFFVHLLPLLIAGTIFKFLERQLLSNTIMGILWMIVAVAYYLLLLVPLVVISVQIIAPTGKSFWGTYISVLPSIRFEVITSSLVSGLYLMQHEIRKTLEHSNKNLEQIVTTRTVELTSANNELLSLNEELKASNDGIKALNENLEQIVKERTEKINAQLELLTKYAHMNSHELRAPLARMLGLLQLIKHENDVEQMKQLLDYLYITSTELDNVIREMNRILEKEILIEENP